MLIAEFGLIEVGVCCVWLKWVVLVSGGQGWPTHTPLCHLPTQPHCLPPPTPQLLNLYGEEEHLLGGGAQSH